jgi:hypothetical protein
MYADQVAFVNGRLLEAIDVMRNARPEPVIILMSDHGSRVFGVEEKLLNFFAAATPGHRGIFPEDATPVNVFVRLGNAYLGTDLPIVPDEFYAVQAGDPLAISRIE